MVTIRLSKAIFGKMPEGEREAVARKLLVVKIAEEEPWNFPVDMRETDTAYDYTLANNASRHSEEKLDRRW